MMVDDPGNEFGASPPRVLRQSVSQLGSDVLTLMELQAELLQVDLKEWGAGFAKAITTLVVAVVLLLASAPVLLMAFGYFLNDATGLSLALSMFLAAATGGGLAAIAAVGGLWMLKRKKGVLHRFGGELRRNVQWIKETLRPTSPAPSEF